MSPSLSSYRWGELLQRKRCRGDSSFQSCWTKKYWLQGPGESKAEKVKMKNSLLKVELHSDPVLFPVGCLWVLSWAYQQPAARGAKRCSGNSALFTKLGTACLTTSRCCFNFLPLGGQFEEHLWISPFLLLASWIHQGRRLIVLAHHFCHWKCEAVLAFSGLL